MTRQRRLFLASLLVACVVLIPACGRGAKPGKLDPVAQPNPIPQTESPVRRPYHENQEQSEEDARIARQKAAQDRDFQKRNHEAARLKAEADAKETAKLKKETEERDFQKRNHEAAEQPLVDAMADAKIKLSVAQQEESRAKQQATQARNVAKAALKDLTECRGMMAQGVQPGGSATETKANIQQAQLVAARARAMLPALEQKYNDLDNKATAAERDSQQATAAVASAKTTFQQATQATNEGGIDLNAALAKILPRLREVLTAAQDEQTRTDLQMQEAKKSAAEAKTKASQDAMDCAAASKILDRIASFKPTQQELDNANKKYMDAKQQATASRQRADELDTLAKQAETKAKQAAARVVNVKVAIRQTENDLR